MAILAPQFDSNFISLEYIFSKIYHFFADNFSYIHGANFSEFIGTLKTISAFLTIILFALLFYIWIRLYEMKKAMDNNSKKEEEIPFQDSIGEGNKQINKQWEHICFLFDSLKESDWRLAIIESNTILEKLVSPMQIKGETTGEKLKNVEPSDFRTAKFAREANYIRNRIAHDGLDFKLDQKEAYRVKALYQSVFEEFNIV